MATVTEHRPTTAPDTTERFGFLLLAEWTKLRSVRRWVIALVAAGIATIGLSVLAASGSATDVNDHPDVVSGPDGTPVSDDFRFVHQPLVGDGTITAHIVSQDSSHPWAGAGVMIKESTRPGSPYAALALTPGHGVRLQANFTTDKAGPAGAAPRWVRLTRTGATVTGFTSTDGTTWQEIGTVTPRGLPSTAEIGLFVSSPPQIRVGRSFGSTSVGATSTEGHATFDNVRLEPASGQTSDWRGDDVRVPGRDLGKPTKVVGSEERDAPPNPNVSRSDTGGAQPLEVDGVFALQGQGEIGPHSPDDDPVQIGLFGVLAGLMFLIAVGALFMTSEYRRGMIRTTFAASPRRGRVLAAKAIVLGAVAFLIGTVSTVAAVLITQPILRDGGFTEPNFPRVSLFDGPVLRAVLCSAVFMAAIAVFSLALGAIFRHSAAAITTAILLVVAPVIVAALLPVSAARALMHLTPAGGFATQRTKPPTATLVEPWSMLGPWSGLGVACCYAVGALLLAGLKQRQRDA